MFEWLSDRALERRYAKILAMRAADHNRYKPNPLGSGYLTRSERYLELLWRIEPELRRRYESE